MHVNNAVAEILLTVAPEQMQTTETMRLKHICKVAYSNTATEQYEDNLTIEVS
jgi:hypothetical protein